MPKTHRRHKKDSHAKGELVEYIGRDVLDRGLGLVLEELFCDTYATGADNGRSVSCVRVYWQNLDREEILHKARVRRATEVIKIKTNKNGKNIKKEE